ncbi:hypothetical protein AX16_002793 [Volvariella volvacea WC 439]|nr:hypothetical protein AX16_002793 [Volvariella volvacea WC 439]
MSRCAGVLGATNQPAWDIMLPYLYGKDVLDVSNIGCILIQVKNDPSVTSNVADKLFRDMDPIFQFLSNKDIPVIRLALSFARDNPEVELKKWILSNSGHTS